MVNLILETMSSCFKKLGSKRSVYPNKWIKMKKLLVIDDEEEIRALMYDYFNGKGYEVLLAKDGVEGEEIYREQPGAIILTDMYMPEQTGLETIWRLRKDYPNLLLIVFSGGNRHQYRCLFEEPESALKAARLLGASYTFNKPVDMNELFKAVENLQKSDME